jgi:hypothetical protein
VDFYLPFIILSVFITAPNVVPPLQNAGETDSKNAPGMTIYSGESNGVVADVLGSNLGRVTSCFYVSLSKTLNPLNGYQQ